MNERLLTLMLLLGGLLTGGIPAAALPSSEPHHPASGWLTAEITIQGKVTDKDKGEAIPGVNVVLKGTQKGTTTDGNGQYSIAVNSTSDVLVLGG